MFPQQLPVGEERREVGSAAVEGEHSGLDSRWKGGADPIIDPSAGQPEGEKEVEPGIAPGKAQESQVSAIGQYSLPPGQQGPGPSS